MIAAGQPKQPAGRTRQARHTEILDRWPVLAEHWARELEYRRVAAQSPERTPMQGISPLTAINRKLGLPDDDGANAVVAVDRRATASA
jgi:hypothetical protein